MKQTLLSIIKWITALALVGGIVMGIRRYCIESYHISTEAMEEALHKGDYIIVNKLPVENNPGRNRIVLFTSPLLKDSAAAALFISRCIGMPGDTIRIGNNSYSVNGKEVPRSPRTLSSYFVTISAKDEFMRALRKLAIPEREVKPESYGFSLCLTAFEEYQLREELSEDANIRFINEQIEDYTLIVPRKGEAYRLDARSLVACKEIILRETNGKAAFRDGKLYIDGKETAFFFFKQDYYWMLSDNTVGAVDSRHLGFIPADHVIGNALFCWYSKDKQRILKPVN
ncbi:signal peptidase I [Parabacteroides bouchesdurhonensis]|uniref:signal peptidase I n=1 Tax=Parabacteroides bouchesdurhonensis TaxID=1936995 RepID=UPI000E4F2342|nr:signal peptidase I [Parabacteroides bouchesdurhonensis]RHJ94099.1 signal peptidase I [Bacteroides sp. AM07-16]